MLKKNKSTEYQLNKAGEFSRAAWVMADCAGTAKSLDDWEFYMDIAIYQCNSCMELLKNKARFTIENVYSNTAMWNIPHFKEANDNYMRLINE